MVSVLKFSFVAALLVVVALALSGAASAEKVGKVSRVSAIGDKSEAMVVLNLEAGTGLTDARISVSIPELGLQKRQNVDLSSRNRASVHVLLPLASLEEPYVRIVFTSDEGRRIVHRSLLDVLG
ncbi:hypothetical protein HYU18_05165 [Candidatus Woesearchaeota archaeon]|nr:hypothetical protein [Candidatus Woesearchaeota archaeon]